MARSHDRDAWLMATASTSARYCGPPRPAPRRGAAAAAGRSRMRHPRFVLLRLRSRRVRPALAWSAPTVAGPSIDMVSLDHAGNQVDEHRPLLRLQRRQDAVLGGERRRLQA